MKQNHTARAMSMMIVAMLMPGIVRTRMSYQFGGMTLEEASQQTDCDFDRPGSISTVAK